MSVSRTLRQVASATCRIASRPLGSSCSRLALHAPKASNASRAFSTSHWQSLSESASKKKEKEKTPKTAEYSALNAFPDASMSKTLAEELVNANHQAEAKKPDILEAFLEKGVWKIEEEAGCGEVVLTREYEDESIRVAFSLDDFQSWDHDGLEEDMDFGDKDTKDAEWEMPMGETMRAVLTVTKATQPSALEFDISVESGGFLIDGVTYYPDATLPREEQHRRRLYTGPEFNMLGQNLQENFTDFLILRGLGDTTHFLPKYAAHKRQLEQARWLKNVKGFIDG
ncbi:mitochondrial glycoprotein [Mycena latifolia]|nr:mitochondrial glycoprotein [Mycena latifolia]